MSDEERSKPDDQYQMVRRDKIKRPPLGRVTIGGLGWSEKKKPRKEDRHER